MKNPWEDPYLLQIEINSECGYVRLFLTYWTKVSRLNWEDDVCDRAVDLVKFPPVKLFSPFWQFESNLAKMQYNVRMSWSNVTIEILEKKQ